MAHSFEDWLTCPDCEENGSASTMAYGTDIVFECYECGLVSEFVVGEAIPIRDLDADATEDAAIADE